MDDPGDIVGYSREQLRAIDADRIRHTAALEAEVSRLRGVLKKIAGLPEQWATCDQVTRNAQVGMHAPAFADAALKASPR